MNFRQIFAGLYLVATRLVGGFGGSALHKVHSHTPIHAPQ